MTSTKACPQCGSLYEAQHRFCTLDGATLIQTTPQGDLIGTVLADRYLVTAKLGDGGMGQVYLAEHVRMKRKCAVKVMRPGLVTDPDAISRFNREAENASQVIHQNVAAIYDFGEAADGLIYLAMEYVDGESLAAVIEREKAMHPVRVAEIIRQAADALDVAHGLGILHRDLKPENIMVTTTREQLDLVKLVDFGIARAMTSDSQRVTRTGSVVGTPEFMSPEQFAGDVLDSRSDLYSLALVAFNMLTGDTAYPSGSSKDNLIIRLTQPPRRLHDVKDLPWPEQLQQTFDKALANDPASRHDSVVEFSREMSAAIAAMPASQTGEMYISALQAALNARAAATPSGHMTPVPGSWGNSSGYPPIRGTGARTGARTGAGTGASTSVATGASTSVATGASTSVGADHGAPSAAGDTADSLNNSHSSHKGQSGANAVTVESPPARGPASPRLLAGAAAGLLVVGILGWVLTRGGDSGAAEQASLAAEADSLAALATAAALADSTGSLATTADSATRSPEDAVYQKARTGVVWVTGKTAMGMGFLADNSGLLLAPTSVVGADTIVSVTIDDATRVRARVVYSDSTRPVSVLAIARTRCRNCAALPLASTDTSSHSATGATVIAIGATRAARPRMLKGTVSSSLARSLATTVRFSASESGAPIMALSGEVIGMVAPMAAANGAPAAAREVPVAELRALLSEGQRVVASPNYSAPSDSLLPVRPRIAFPHEAIAAVAAQDNTDLLRRYRVSSGDFEMLVMTPPVMGWREARALAAAEALKSAAPAGTNTPVKVDPIQGWPGWDPCIRERCAVVLLNVVPDRTPLLYHKSGEVLNFSRGDVRTFTLYRDGRPVEPIEVAFFPAALNAADYTSANRPLFRQGVAMYSAAEFAPPPGGGLGRFEVLVVDGTRPDRTQRLAIPAAMVQAIVNDFAPYGNAR